MTKFMSRLLLALLVLLFCSVSFGQVIPNPFIFVGSDPNGACSNFGPTQFNYMDGVMWNCVGGTWTAYTGSAGAGTVTMVTVAGTTNQLTATGTCASSSVVNCTFSVPSDFRLPGTINKVTITQPATGATITIPDGVTMNGPSASSTVATLSLTNTFTGRQDASGAASTSPLKVGTVAGLPGTCTVGDMYFANNATAGANAYFCTATNTWTQMATGGGSGTVTVSGGGSLCSTCIVTGAGTTVIQTASSTTQLASNGDITTPGAISSGVGSGAAGALQLHSGTAPTANSGSFGWAAGTSMTTSVILVSPDAVPAADSMMLWTAAPSSNLAPWSYKTITNCGDATHAVSYSTSTHAWGCQAITATASAGGSNTQIQYNNATALGGVSNFTSDGTNVFFSAITAPSTPASGFGIPYLDSTAKALTFKNDAGTVTHTVATVTCTNQFLRVISDAGATTCTTVTSAYADSSIVKTGSSNTYTAGANNFADVSMIIPNPNAGSTSEGQFAMDSNLNLRMGDGSVNTIVGLVAAAPTNGNCVSWSVVTSKVRLADSGGGCGSAPLRSIGATFTNGTSALSTGTYCCLIAPAGGTISAWSIVVDDNTGSGTCSSCTATVKFWRIAGGTMVTTTPTSSNSINSMGVSLASGTSKYSTTTSDFSLGAGTTVTANDIYAVTITAVANAHSLTAKFDYQ